MLIITSVEDLGFKVQFDQPSNEVLDELRISFQSKYGKEIYGKSDKIIVFENNFFNIIKNRYGPSLIGEHMDDFDSEIDSYLAI